MANSILSRAIRYANECLDLPQNSARLVVWDGFSDSRGRSVHYHNTYIWGWGPSRGCADGVDGSCGHRRDAKEEKRQGRSFFGVVGAVVVLATSYWIGSDIGRIWRIDRMVEEIQTDQNQSTCLPESVDDVAQSHIQMLQDEGISTMNGLMLKSALAASAAMVAVGAFWAAAPAALMPGGVLAGAVSCALLLVRAGYNSADTTLIEEALKLRQQAKDAQNSLWEKR